MGKLACLLLTVLLWLFTGPAWAADPARVHFIDVGQADAIYISLPGHNDILIDGGNAADGQLVVSYLKSQNVDDIELIIATHPHEDHIGGLPAVLDAFLVEKIIDSGKTLTTDVYKTYAAKVRAQGAHHEADNYQEFIFNGITLKILTGNGNWSDTNDYSTVCLLDTGDIEFLFTGDAGKSAETFLRGNINSEILKVGHHGSQTSSSIDFLNSVKPEVAVISVGSNNSNGHPSAKTIRKLEDMGAIIYRTDIHGTITVESDGTTYSVTTEKAVLRKEAIKEAALPAIAWWIPGMRTDIGLLTAEGFRFAATVPVIFYRALLFLCTS